MKISDLMEEKNIYSKKDIPQDEELDIKEEILYWYFDFVEKREKEILACPYIDRYNCYADIINRLSLSNGNFLFDSIVAKEYGMINAFKSAMNKLNTNYIVPDEVYFKELKKSHSDKSDESQALYKCTISKTVIRTPKIGEDVLKTRDRTEAVFVYAASCGCFSAISHIENTKGNFWTYFNTYKNVDAFAPKSIEILHPVKSSKDTPNKKFVFEKGDSGYWYAYGMRFFNSLACTYHLGEYFSTYEDLSYFLFYRLKYISIASFENSDYSGDAASLVNSLAQNTNFVNKYIPDTLLNSALTKIIRYTDKNKAKSQDNSKCFCGIRKFIS